MFVDNNKTMVMTMEGKKKKNPSSQSVTLFHNNPKKKKPEQQQKKGKKEKTNPIIKYIIEESIKRKMNKLRKK